MTSGIFDTIFRLGQLSRLEILYNNARRRSYTMFVQQNEKFEFLLSEFNEQGGSEDLERSHAILGEALKLKNLQDRARTDIILWICVAAEYQRIARELQ